MSRKIVPAEERRSYTIQATLKVSELTALDRARGQQSRSDYVRALLVAALAQEAVQP